MDVLLAMWNQTIHHGARWVAVMDLGPPNHPLEPICVGTSALLRDDPTQNGSATPVARPVHARLAQFVTNFLSQLPEIGH